MASDNRELNQTALNLLNNLQGQTASLKGQPIQVIGTLAIPFSTSSGSGEASTDISISQVVPATVQAGRKTSGTSPSYPPDAKLQHISGTVFLHAVIGKDGTVTQLVVIDSPSPILTKAAMDGVRTWKYSPYLFNGLPTPVDTTITVDFSTSVHSLGSPSSLEYPLQ